MLNGLIIDEYGNKFYYKNDMRHNEDGPAAVYSHGSEEWFINDERHRITGPAVKLSDGTEYWYLHDVEMTEEEHAAAVAKM